MPTGKRASMREGPLASLFRKTADDTGGDHPTEQSEPGNEPAAPSAPAARQQEPTVRTPVDEPAAAPGPPVEPTVPAEFDPEGPPVPSPQERLRHAFSADVPESVMAPPAKPGRGPAPVQDVYARPERTAEAFAPPPAAVKKVVPKKWSVSSMVTAPASTGMTAISR